MKSKKFPDTLTLIFILLLFATVLTWFIPAGEFDRAKINGKDAVVPGSYHEVEQSPQHIQVFIAPIKGFIAQAEVIGFIFLIGGVFFIINSTGAINAGLFKIIDLSKNSPTLKAFVIPLLMTFFSIGGATFGMAEETLVFIMMTIPLAIALGFDSIVGLSIAFVGAALGFAGAFFNPFTVGVAQGIAELAPFSGLSYRLIVWLVYTAVGILYVFVYARRVEKDFSKSLVGKIDYGKDLTDTPAADKNFNTKRILILGLLFLSIIALAIGVQQDNPAQLASLPYFLRNFREFFIGFGMNDWYIIEISALFLGLGLLTGLIYGYNAQTMVNHFWEGCKEMVIPAVLVAFARGILVIAEDGKIIDTVLFWISEGAEDLPAMISVQIMFLVQGLINTFIPSGSGQAALTMPIMAPLADVLGFSRQTAVLAFQFGDGITNMIIPTSAVLMGVLQIAKIPFNKWFKFILPLVIILYLVSMILLAIAVSINYS